MLTLNLNMFVVDFNKWDTSFFHNMMMMFTECRVAGTSFVAGRVCVYHLRADLSVSTCCLKFSCRFSQAQKQKN